MSEFQNIYASLVSFINDFNSNTTTGTPGFLDFDQHEEIDKIPNTDLVGMRGLSVTADGVTYTAEVLIVVSTWDDTSLFRLRAYIDELFGKLLPGMSIPFKNATTGDEAGYLAVRSGTSVIPIARSEKRSFQQIAVNLLGDRKL